MSDRRDQIWEEEREGAMTSLETKLSVVPGRKADGQIMADWVGDDIVRRSVKLRTIGLTRR